MLLWIDCDTDARDNDNAIICGDCGAPVERTPDNQPACECGTHAGPDHML